MARFAHISRAHIVTHSLRAALAILLETARRIRARHKLSMVEIDRTGVLPYKLRTTSDWGAIWAENMRCGGASALPCRFAR